MRYAVKTFGEASENRSKNSFVVSNFFIFSTIPKRQCCALNPCLKPHWNFDQCDSKYSLICWCIHLSYSFDIFDKNTDRSVVILILLIIFLYTGKISAHLSSSRKKPLSKHSLKFLARESPKISLNSSIILCGMSFDFETF